RTACCETHFGKIYTCLEIILTLYMFQSIVHKHDDQGKGMNMIHQTVKTRSILIILPSHPLFPPSNPYLRLHTQRLHLYTPKNTN
ncbi:unnamed protein product, partial [Brassica oleracea var. botrytis]